MRTRFTVPDVHCEHCVEALTGALAPQPGVEGVEVDLESKTVTVVHDEEAASRLADLIEAQGYEVAGREAVA